MRRSCLVLTGVLVFLNVLAFSGTAKAAFHLMHISEVMVGAGGDCRLQFVELQMTSQFQNRVNNHRLFFFDAEGNQVGEFTMDRNVPNATRRDGVLPYILIGTREFADASSVAPDFIMPTGLLFPEGGRVSFDNPAPTRLAVDSVAYGAYTGDNGTHGAPAAAPDVLAIESLLRTGPGENNDAANFAVGAPTPTNNNFEEGTVTPPGGEPNCGARPDECFFRDSFDDLSNWDEIAPNAGLDLTDCLGDEFIADIGEVQVSDNKLLLIPGVEDHLDLGQPISFTGLTNAAASEWADEPSYRLQFDMLAQPGILIGAVFVHEHYAFDDAVGTVDILMNSGFGMNFSFDNVTEGSSDHVHPDIRLQCLAEGAPDAGPGNVDFTEFELMVSNQQYTVILDVDGDDVDGPLTLQVKVFESDQEEPDDYMATWKLTLGLMADADPDLDHGILIAALGQNPAAMEITNLTVCPIPLKDKHVRYLTCIRNEAGSILVQWDNPFDAEAADIAIMVNGEVDGTVGGFDAEYLIEDPPQGQLTITVTNYSGVAVECKVCPPDVSISGPTEATLEEAMGGLSYSAETAADPEGTVFIWSVVESPQGSNPMIDAPEAQSINLTADMEGEYVLQLDLTDESCPFEGQFTSVEVTLIVSSLPAGVGPFIRGDCNGDDGVNLADAICTFNWLFAGTQEPGCVAAVNTNGDAAANISDATYLLNYLFLGAAEPVAPFPDCGLGMLPADAQLGCANPPNCQ